MLWPMITYKLLNEKIHGKPYKVGDLVWLHNPAMPRGQARKLYCPWTGPYKVVKILSTVVYWIQDTRGRRRRKIIHFNRLKPYLSRSNPLVAKPSLILLPRSRISQLPPVHNRWGQLYVYSMMRLTRWIWTNIKHRP